MRDMEVIETEKLTDREGTYKERETDRDTEKVTNKNKKYNDRGQDRDVSSKNCNIKNKCDDINRKKCQEFFVIEKNMEDSKTEKKYTAV